MCPHKIRFGIIMERKLDISKSFTKPVLLDFISLIVNRIRYQFID
jgi:hypothetical protein